MALKTFAEMITLLADNTSGDISAVDMRDVIKGLWRRQIASYTVDNAADVYWESNAGDFTTVTVSGSQTITETEGVLSVLFSGQGAADHNAFVKAHTFSVGDRFATRIRLLSSSLQYNISGLVFTDGTASTSNCIMALAYINQDDTGILACFHGTLTNVATAAWTNAGKQGSWANDGAYVRLTYTASNSFTAEFSPDGVSWTSFGNGAVAKTMTPTHFGVSFTKIGATGESITSFGPICKLA